MTILAECEHCDAKYDHWPAAGSCQRCGAPCSEPGDAPPWVPPVTFHRAPVMATTMLPEHAAATMMFSAEGPLKMVDW